ncbi:hypothetical protein LG296_13380 [Ureibacillus chungkukjangi]|uniref:hypothetical protein n=1 Tax=Ureibacillus chungkukjangi TaxID=1202712 RepID=UPI00203C94D0|nr:hypothetical protein [Ureibacillus chungkukjangi]MCM3387489.1 hypothetical protein [Ureibacillus chungkukjangi]
MKSKMIIGILIIVFGSFVASFQLTDGSNFINFTIKFFGMTIAILGGVLFAKNLQRNSRK